MAFEQKKAARDFAEYWKGKGYEKGESQKFWLSLLHNVLGVEAPEKYISFEDQVHLDHTSFIDGYIDETHVLIEQKSIGKNLRAGIIQSDGAVLSPFLQAKRYSVELPYDKRPRWIVTCNFESFLVYDMNNPNGEPEEILLENLPKEYYRLEFLTNKTNLHLKKEMDLSIQAGSIVGKLYDALLAQYQDPDDEKALKSLNMLCVRLVFCLYAEDAGIFGHKNIFCDYLKRFEPRDMRRAIIDLFAVLNQKPEERDPYLEDELSAFPYVNGGMFADNSIEIPHFTDEVKNLLITKASEDFDWSEISPTIFGAVFESTLNPETRRSGGMHYTSIENIHKVIDPLFLNDLKTKLSKAREIREEKKRNAKLLEFQKELGELNFLDPACGSGNFLTETFLSLRRLENEALKSEMGDQITLGVDDIIHVGISQFHGIEINDFAATVAKTALWIAESQMMRETSDIVQTDMDFLPLKTNANIVEGNALRIDWEDVAKKDELDYIMGNPPFVGARLMDCTQKGDMIDIFGEKWKNIGNMDYVCCWYKKAADMMKDTSIRTALVSTNSITQGEQVGNLWKPLIEQYGVNIDFAWRTFIWNNETIDKAHVHCVIVGFSVNSSTNNKLLYTEGGNYNIVNNINPYLVDAENIIIESRTKPLCDVPEIGIGNKPIDGGNYLFTEEEKKEFIKKEPNSEKYFRPWIGADEFIKGNKRFCLWLGDCSPAELKSMPECIKRVKAVRDVRLASKSEGTRKIAEKPTRFHVENMPKSNYIIIPETSSERRRYIPIGFLTPYYLCSNAVRLIPDATIYHFGVLTSNVHNAWMRAVCGRLEMRYRYSKDVVYNNFPWPIVDDKQRKKIETTAQAILDARAKYPDSSLADLYDDLVMPVELRKAHQMNDRAVMEAYGFSTKMTESECVAELLKMYQQLIR